MLTDAYCDYCRSKMPDSLVEKIRHMQQHVQDGLCSPYEGQYHPSNKGQLVKYIVSALRRHERSSKLGLSVSANITAQELSDILNMLQWYFIDDERESVAQ